MHRRQTRGDQQEGHNFLHEAPEEEEPRRMFHHPQQERKKTLVVVALATLLVIVTLFLGVRTGYAPVVFLNREQQLLVRSPWDKTTYDGPGVVFLTPVLKHGKKRKATLVDERSYVVVKNTLTGKARSIGGPKLFFPGAYESMGRKERKVILAENEYVKLRSRVTGAVRVMKGPGAVVPDANDDIDDHGKALALDPTEFCKLRDGADGRVRIVKGPSLVFPRPLEDLPRKPQKGYELEKHQYVKLIDAETGIARVERGENLVFPTATENDAVVQDAVFVDAETAVLVVSKDSGQQRLVTTRGPFFPGPHEDILEVRRLIKVQPHEVAVVVDDTGLFHFFDGGSKKNDENEEGTAFFLPPHHTLYTMMWGSGTSKEDLDNNVVKNAKTVAYKVPVQKIDVRSSYAFFEYNVRTADNVELVLEGTIFWQVIDVPKMIEATADPKGDVWYHARSALIQSVSLVTLEKFMQSFNDIVAQAAATDSTFYTDRGVALHKLEVTRYECADPATGAVLQQIIQETTNRINALQKQTSANDVKRQQINGDVDVEKQRTALVDVKTTNDQTLAEMDGKADGLRLANSVDTFLELLDGKIPDLDKRIDLLQFFLNNQLADKQSHNIANGNAHLFLTPDNLNLKFHLRDNDGGPTPSSKSESSSSLSSSSGSSATTTSAATVVSE